jgi:hypothetical protein
MNKFFGAFEQAAISSIDAFDIAASAAAVLTSPPGEPFFSCLGF